MADAPKDSEPKEAPKKAPAIDPKTIYAVQLKKYVPDYNGSPLVMTTVYHVGGSILAEWQGMGIVATFEEANHMHPDAQAPKKLDPPESDVIDARHSPTDEPFIMPPRGQV